MPGITPVSGDITMDVLANTLTVNEQLLFEQVTELAFDPTQARNLVTMVAQPNQLGTLTICASGAASEGTKILSATIYVCGTRTAVDVYRLPLG
jgi:hypothetical protein